MNVTCAALVLALSNPAGGGNFTLTSDCPSPTGKPALEISAVYRKPVIINAHGRTVKGIVFNGGGNVVWKGGQIEAPSGSGENLQQTGPRYYGVLIKGQSRNVVFDAVRFTNARKAIVFGAPAEGLTIRNSICQGEVEDCLIATGGKNIDFSHNIAGPFVMKPSFCILGQRRLDGMRKRECAAQGGEWQNGWHSDVLQLRNGVSNVLVSNNTINTKGQGLTQMDKESDAPIRQVRFTNNRVMAGRHGITLGRCEDCLIDQNVLKTANGHLKWKAVILPGQSRACGNTVPSGGAGRQKC